MGHRSFKSNKGQSTIEFVMTFTVAVGFIFLFLKMALNYTDGFMVHHATFLASRAYMVNDQDRQTEEDGDARALAKARAVFTKYLPEGFVKNVDAGMIQENNPEPMKTKFHAFVGLWVEYSQRFSMGFIGGKESIRFVSESFLGREPTRRESRDQIKAAMKEAFDISCEFHVTMEDNGG